MGLGFIHALKVNSMSVQFSLLSHFPSCNVLRTASARVSQPACLPQGPHVPQGYFSARTNWAARTIFPTANPQASIRDSGSSAVWTKVSGIPTRCIGVG